MAFSDFLTTLTHFVTQTFDNSTVPWADGAYSIKRHGVSISNCDSEPVQTPGCIQAHGTLLVLRLSDLTMLQASENTLDHLGRAPEDLLGRPISTVVGSERETQLRAFLAKEPVERNPLYVFTFPARADTGPLDISIHTIDGLAVLEFEGTGRGEGNIDPDYYALVKQSMTRLQTAQTLDDFCQIVAEEVRGLTGLDRVMVYRFHEDFHGEVSRRASGRNSPDGSGCTIPPKISPSRRARFSKKSGFARCPTPVRRSWSWCHLSIPTWAKR